MITTKTITVLVIDDSPSELELMSHYLGNSGYSVIKTTSAKEGYEIALKEQPDVIITDVVMPGMSGFELCRCLKKNPETRELPIVICTSKNQSIDRLWGIRQGADIYLTKPYSREQLVNAVSSFGKLV